MTDNNTNASAHDATTNATGAGRETQAAARHTEQSVAQRRHASRHMRPADADANAADANGAPSGAADAPAAEKSVFAAHDRLSADGVLPILACALLAVFVAVVVCVLHVPKYAADIDDFAQALYARGALFDTPSYLMPYSMVIYSAPLGFLYGIAPGVPWYPLSLLGLQAVSFAAMFNLARRLRCSVAVRVFVLAALALCEFMVCDYLTFSAAAVVAFGAGMSLVLARGCFSRPRTVGAGAILGYVLVTLGVAVRYDVCFAATLVFVPFLVWAIVRNRNLRTMLMAAGVVACIAVSYVSGQVAWRTWPGWEDYVPNQEAASSIADYPRVSYEDAQRVAPQLSKNDVDMLYEFMFVDSDPFTLETFQALDGVVQTFGAHTLMGAVRSRGSYTVAVLGLVATAFASAILLGVSRRMSRRGMALLLSVCAVTLVETFLLFLRARPRMHVVLPLFVATMFALVVAALNSDPTALRAAARDASAAHAGARAGARAGDAEKSPRPSWLRLVAPVAGIVVFALLAGLIEVKYARPLQRSLSAELTQRAEAYVDAHPDQTVLFLRSQGVIENRDAFAFDRWQVPANVVMIGGGYEYYTTPWKNYLARTGLDRTHYLSYLVQDKGMVSVCNERIAHMVETYLHEHTGKAVRAEKVESIGRGTQSPDEFFVWRFVAGEAAADAHGGTPADGAHAQGPSAGPEGAPADAPAVEPEAEPAAA